MPTTMITGSASFSATSAMVSWSEIGASQPPAPSTSTRSEAAASLANAPAIGSWRIATPSARAARCGDAGVFEQPGIHVLVRGPHIARR